MIHTANFGRMLLAIALFTFLSGLTVDANPVNALAQDEGLTTVQASDDNLSNLAERYLTAFDVSLASQIKPYVVQLNDRQKEQFLKDIEELNDAIEDEILTELYKKASEDDGENEDISALYGKISKEVVDRVLAKNQEKPWLSRIMTFASNEIETSAKKVGGMNK